MHTYNGIVHIVNNLDQTMFSKLTGTSRMGIMDISYAELKKSFGPPLGTSADDKVDAEWGIIFDDGVVATIYNYKNGPAYLGEGGTQVENIRAWHIGGKDREAALRVVELFDHLGVQLV